MARRSHSRRRFVTGVLGIAVTAAVGGGSLFVVTSSAGARVGSGAPAGADSVIVCESGTISHGGVDTSSAFAVRVPAGTPVPPGCRSG